MVIHSSSLAAVAHLRELRNTPSGAGSERTSAIRARIDDLRPASRRSLSTLKSESIKSLFNTIQFACSPFAAGRGVWWNNWSWSPRRWIPIIKLCSGEIESMPTRKPVPAGSALSDPLCKRAEAQWAVQSTRNPS